MTKLNLYTILALSLLTICTLVLAGEDGVEDAPTVPEGDASTVDTVEGGDDNEDDWDNWDVTPEDDQGSEPSENNPMTRAHKKKKCDHESDCEEGHVCQRHCVAKCRKPQADEECMNVDNHDLEVGIQCENDCNCAAELKCYMDGSHVQRCTEQIPGAQGVQPKCAKKCKKGKTCQEVCHKKCIPASQASDECQNVDNGNLDVGADCDNDCNCGPHLKCVPVSDTLSKCAKHVSGGDKAHSGKLEHSMIDGLLESSVHFNKEKDRE